jgi:hypothetical protein
MLCKFGSPSEKRFSVPRAEGLVAGIDDQSIHDYHGDIIDTIVVAYRVIARWSLQA